MSRRLQIAVLLLVIVLSGLGVTFFAGHKGGGEALLQKGREAFEKGLFDEAIQDYTQLTQKSSSPDLLAEAYQGIGDVQFEKKSLLEAKTTYEKIIKEFPRANAVFSTQEKLGRVNTAILFSPVVTPLDKKIEVRLGDTLGKIAASHGTTVDLLMKANQLKTSVIRSGMKLKVPAIHFSIIVDKSQNTLTLKAGEEIFKVYRVATGQNNSTPVGTFKITNKLVNPVWYTVGAVVPPESPENILGSRWLGISEPGYGIHGTRDPSSIGEQVTKGCVRMRNVEVEELYAIVPVGTEVTIID